MNPPERVFLLSPASTSGKRAQLLLNEKASFDLAVRMRSGVVSIADAFSFLSGLYFRGKITYARRFAPDTSIRVITSDRGLVDPSTALTLDDLRAMAEVDIHHDDARFRAPMEESLEVLANALPADATVVLLGSIATPKYVEPAAARFGNRLLFPSEFVGRGDMSRGGLLLRHAAEGVELDYQPVLGAITKGKRPPRLERVS